MAEREWTQEEIDEDMFRWEDEEDGIEAGEECGRWINSRLTGSCTLAGTEQCDFECPYRSSLYGRK